MWDSNNHTELMKFKPTEGALCAELHSMSWEQGSSWTAREWTAVQQRADFMEYQENQAEGILEINQRWDFCSGMTINGCRSRGHEIPLLPAQECRDWDLCRLGMPKNSQKSLCTKCLIGSFGVLVGWVLVGCFL